MMPVVHNARSCCLFLVLVHDTLLIEEDPQSTFRVRTSFGSFSFKRRDGVPREAEEDWVEEHKLEAHSDWVRDVAWAPTVGRGRSTIASCSQDCRVILWTCPSGSNVWSHTLLGAFDDVIWLVSWSVTGSMLAVSGGDNNVRRLLTSLALIPRSA
ncbi:hypothetical protein HPB47_005459 [Ixodes persulcatus]|uniref:Uncharacterized protein n=1 Tax=Ixodes persulcatus TaxID=34615 RepID=A0AC60PD09_IXOPE|nr:hypothetical protein HPB47_005459 [Ixodes persulcatus]